jgi:hypothetical protein
MVVNGTDKNSELYPIEKKLMRHSSSGPFSTFGEANLKADW